MARSFFDTEQVSTRDAVTRVQDKLSSRADKRIYIKADGHANYGKVVKWWTSAFGGVDQLGLLTEQITTPGNRQAAPTATTLGADRRRTVRTTAPGAQP